MTDPQQSLPLFIEQEPEDNNTEFKTCTGGRIPKDLWQSISAFSNTEGGRIIFGVTPDGKHIDLSREEIDELQLDIASLCNASFNCTITPEILNADGVLVINIPPVAAQLRPVFQKSKGMHKGSYVRIGSSNHVANEEWLKRFAVAAKGGAETIDYPGSRYTDLLDLSAFDDFIAHLNSRRGNVYQSFTQEEILIKQKAITKDLDVTLFGLLAFGKDLVVQETIAPTVNISVTQYPGLSKINEDDLSETYMDNREFDGNVIKQFSNAFQFIKTKLPIRGTVDANGKRRDYLVIPEIALREALANAIAHREYSSHASSIQVDIFADRLEIINPGISLVPIEQLDTAPSSSRNPLLMSFMKEHGITDQKARGIRTIKVSLKKAGLLEPAFENLNQSFRVTLYASAFISSVDKAWLAQFTPLTLNDRQQNALVHARNDSTGISNSEYRNINNMNNVRDDKKANKELKHLVTLGLLVIAGENKARRYVLNEEYR